MLKLVFMASMALWVAMPGMVAAEDVWHVKALSDGNTLGVKAIDSGGKMHGVKATGAGQVKAVQARVNGEILPIKLIDQGGKHFSVKAIRKNGTLMDIKAIGAGGKKLDVKGVAQDGHVFHIKAIDGDKQLGVKAIGPQGTNCGVKGLRLSADAHEGEVNGVKFHGHVKAICP